MQYVLLLLSIYHYIIISALRKIGRRRLVRKARFRLGTEPTTVQIRKSCKLLKLFMEKKPLSYYDIVPVVDYR